jgi:hypothetical protein
MSRDTPQTRTLYRAVAVCGGVAALAKALDVSIEALSRWLDGDAIPTVDIYGKALDLVASGRQTALRPSKA